MGELQALAIAHHRAGLPGTHEVGDALDHVADLAPRHLEAEGPGVLGSAVGVAPGCIARGDHALQVCKLVGLGPGLVDGDLTLELSGRARCVVGDEPLDLRAGVGLGLCLACACGRSVRAGTCRLGHACIADIAQVGQGERHRMLAHAAILVVGRAVAHVVEDQVVVEVERDHDGVVLQAASPHPARHVDDTQEVGVGLIVHRTHLARPHQVATPGVGGRERRLALDAADYALRCHRSLSTPQPQVIQNPL